MGDLDDHHFSSRTYLRIHEKFKDLDCSLLFQIYAIKWMAINYMMKEKVDDSVIQIKNAFFISIFTSIHACSCVV
jgi:hypothetical protein